MITNTQEDEKLFLCIPEHFRVNMSFRRGWNTIAERHEHIAVM